MAEWQSDTLQDYQRKGFAARSGYGKVPALLVIDFINAFTDPTTPLGGDFSAELAVTRDLQAACRRSGMTIVYTTIAFESDYRDAGLFIKKVPSLSILVKGSPMVEVDARIAPLADEIVVEKKFASAFFGTGLDVLLRGLGVDTVIMAGCTTSGCVRASAIDSLQFGFHTVVVREGVGDRAAGPHEANLFDIDAKYGDVVSSVEALEYLDRIGAGEDLAARAREGFGRWWHDDAAND